MKLKIVPRWRRVLVLSLSLWAIYLSGFFAILPFVVPYLDGVIPRWLSIGALLLSPLGRIIDQGGIDADK
jgi:hypothetical protein